jgi:HAMP domain-containing protein
VRVTRKLPAVFAGLVLVCCVVVGGASYLAGTGIVRSQAEGRLMAVAESRKDKLLSALNGVRSTLLSNAQSKTVRAALADFENGWVQHGSKAGSILMKSYITDNPHPENERAELAKAGQNPYDRSHSKFHPILRQLAQENGIQDTLLINSEGRVVYSVRKQSDFAADLRSPEWETANVALAFERAMEGGAESTHFFDLQAYRPNSDKPTSFFSAPVSTGNKNVGALIHHVPTDKISSLLAEYADLGKTGNVFLVNENGLIQNDSHRTDDVSELLYSSLSRREVMSVLGNSRNYVRLAGLLGADVEAAIVPFEFLGRNYAVVVTQETAEVEAPLTFLMNLILGLIVVCTLAAVAVGAFVARGLTGRINRLSDAMSQMLDGNPTAEVSARAGGDEIDDMATAVAGFRTIEIRQQQLEVDQWVADEESDAQAKRVKELVDRFVADVATA